MMKRLSLTSSIAGEDGLEQGRIDGWVQVAQRPQLQARDARRGP